MQADRGDMDRHTIGDLHQMQSLPLAAKIRMTEYRIRQWVENYGEDGVYVSFSGGKDSTVLLDMVRKIYRGGVKAIYVDTGLEYPEIREFVKLHGNVEVLRPKINFRQVIEKYGYPFIGKEVAGCVYGARRYMERLACGEVPGTGGKVPVRYLILQGKYPHKEKGKETAEYSRLYNKERYRFFLEAPFEISDRCCDVMKKAPMHSYAKRTGRVPMTAQMASESRLRTANWLKNGCNGFGMKSPVSNPMSFWVEQDVLEYIYHNHLPIAPVYGEVRAEDPDGREWEGQGGRPDAGIFDRDRPVYTTTGCSRTGCVWCGFGCHREKSPNRWEAAEKYSNPAIIDYMLRGGSFAEDGLWKPDSRGLGFWFVIEWINAHGNLRIVMPHRERYLGQYMDAETEKYLVL